MESITSLPSLIVNGIKSIFIPDNEVLKDNFNSMVSNVTSKIGIDDSLANFGDSITEKPVEDIEAEYDIYGLGTLKLSFFNTEYLKDGVEFFRPVIRGFIVLLLVLFNYRNILSFIGQDPTIAHNAMQKAKGDD